ncbi:uncharacterized protein LOC141695952 [Apium graveolens]|uniref:uncharacterized protein LOC141695952 n=1 Tax=Apium graveolens TaxID=4045 RepID=UPI003D7AF959
MRGEFACIDRGFWRIVWGLQFPGKVTNLLWRVSRGVLPTAVALLRKHVIISHVCSWCHEYNEDDLHILFDCCFAKKVWHVIGLLNIVQVNMNDTVIDVLKRASTIGTEDQWVMGALFCRSIWYRRNRWVWDKLNVSVFGIKSVALNLLTDWRRMMEENGGKKGGAYARYTVWCKPPEGWIKVNIDATCHQGSEFTGIGCVTRDDRGRFIRA